MAPILRTEHLTHIYGKGTPFETAALNDIDYTVEKGELIGIIGHTGSGKSTFIQHLNGILKPTSGKVLLDGEDINASAESLKRARSRVGLVFQYPEYQLFEETVEKDISFGPGNMGLSEEEIKERVLEAADFVEIGESLLSKSPFELSGGQKRRAAIAGVIAMRPEVLVLDEPTAGLDPAGRKRLIGNILRYHEETGAAVIMISHSMDEIAESVRRVTALKNGSIVMDGTPREVFSQAEKLKKLGLSVPQVTKIAIYLREMGLPADTSVYTMSQAADAIASLKGGGSGA
ncbi:MAG: energy-coupling factor transporter ATPase [Oscillospiraceae bacterium]|nr:energy-coupling factor transporter ATPase [Oscillospiraceae bacterium]